MGHGFECFARLDPLFLQDGQYVDQELLMATNPAEIERIEVVKNSGATIYGARGGAGVIAFFTRKWKPDQLNPGGKQLSVTGYPLPRQFTFPAHNAYPGDRIDRRDVLLWQPQLQTDAQGQVTLKFPLSDMVRTLRVTVQGITATGQPVSVERVVRVQ
ncbi:MAG: TonB-dependent receptor plug domain-containing protein [Rudanella sp.]|nr:TonB-dependent receptor plug domain-containing protein [Rudanella sp.]